MRDDQMERNQSSLIQATILIIFLTLSTTVLAAFADNQAPLNGQDFDIVKSESFQSLYLSDELIICIDIQHKGEKEFEIWTLRFW